MHKQTWNDKRYHSLDYHLKKTFGKKIYKIALNGGMTCPNRDGTLDERGCIFCSRGGSGDFASSPLLSITEQIEEGKGLVKHKLPANSLLYEEGPSYIAYFQAFTNTYGSVSYLRKIFTEAITHPDIALLSIATRPDCLDDDILSLLSELNQIKPVWIELGLQTCHEKTANFIRRGYSLPVFENSIHRLKEASITTVVHVILGLPFETNQDMLETVSYVASLQVEGIKLQLLHVLQDTDLADVDFNVLTMEEYISILIQCIEILPSDIVIHRLTGDGNKNQLLRPMWSGNKKLVLNTINQELKKRNTWQGKKRIQ